MEMDVSESQDLGEVAIATACSPQCRNSEQSERLTGSENHKEEGKKGQGTYNAPTLIPTSKLIQCGLFLIKVPTPQYIVIYVCLRQYSNAELMWFCT